MKARQIIFVSVNLNQIKGDDRFKEGIDHIHHICINFCVPSSCSVFYCYMRFHCHSFHVVQSIIISFILSGSRLKLSRVTSLPASVASAVNLVVSFASKNGSISGSINFSNGW